MFCLLHTVRSFEATYFKNYARLNHLSIRQNSRNKGSRPKNQEDQTKGSCDYSL